MSDIKNWTLVEMVEQWQKCMGRIPPGIACPGKKARQSKGANERADSIQM